MASPLTLSPMARPRPDRAVLVAFAVATSALVPFFGAGCSDDTATPAVTPGGGDAGTSAGTGGSTGTAGKSGGAGKGGTSSDAGAGGSEGIAGNGGAAGDDAGGGTTGDAGKGGTGGTSAGQAGQGGSGDAGSGGASAGGTSGGSAGKAGAPNKFPFQTKYAIQSQFPEGGIYDSNAHVFYVGSLKDGGVRRIDAASGAETEIFKETAAGHWWTLGMDVDLVRRRLWVCAMDDRTQEGGIPPKSREGRVWVFDLKDNKRIADYPLKPAQSDGTCTDVALADNGDAYITDRERGIVYRATLDTPPAIFATDPLLDGDLAGLNGMSVLPDQSALLAVVYRPPRLVRVDLTTKKTTEVDIDGPFLDSTPLAGADGLTLFKGNAYVAFSNRFIQVVPKDGTWAKGVSTGIDDVPEGLTDVVATPNGLYFLNGQSIAFALKTTPKPFELKLFDGIL